MKQLLEERLLEERLLAKQTEKRPEYHQQLFAADTRNQPPCLCTAQAGQHVIELCIVVKRSSNVLTDFVSYFYLILSLFREGVGAPLLKSVQRYNKFFIPANFSPYFAAFIPHLVLKIPYFTQNYQTKPIASWNILQSLFFHLIQKFAQQLVTLLAALYPPQWFLNGSQ